MTISLPSQSSDHVPGSSPARQYWTVRWRQEVLARIVTGLQRRGPRGAHLRRLARALPAAALLLALCLPPGVQASRALEPAGPVRAEHVARRPYSWPPALDLATDASSTLFGAESENWSGRSVSDAGDVNGDGFADLLIGAPSPWVYYGAGLSYLVFGGPSVSASLDLGSLGSAGVTLVGALGDYSGWSVSGAGDVNGDGFDDLLVGAPGRNGYSAYGVTYLVFGGASLPATLDLGSLGGAGVTILGAEGDYSGWSVSGAGDVNGDGFDDVLVGALYAPSYGYSTIYRSYLVFGGSSLPPTLDLGALGSAGTVLHGWKGYGSYDTVSVSGAGDVNGDGFDDLLVGDDSAYIQGTDTGKSTLVFGAASLPSTLDLDALGSAGVNLFGGSAGNATGSSVSGAGDINGDGFDDLLVGAAGADGPGNARVDAGNSYLVFGSASLPVAIDLTSLGSAGVTLFGAEAGDGSGASVSDVGDVNGDGFEDLLIGAPGAAGPGNLRAGAGESYLVFGSAGLPATLDLGSLGDAGITLFGAEVSDTSGFSVSGAGDVNADGLHDLLVGAYRADGAGNTRPDAGETYLVLGRPANAHLIYLPVSLR